jgi:hypothetical protein
VTLCGVHPRQEEAAACRNGGYLAAGIGTLTGGIVGVATGRLIGTPLAEQAAGQVDASGDSEGLQGIIEGAGAGIGAFILGIFVFIVAVLMVAWLGTVCGCGVALRLSGHADARRTALLTGCVALPAVLAVSWVAEAVYRPDAGAESYPIFVVAGVLAASTARWLTLNRPDHDKGADTRRQPQGRPQDRASGL